MQPLEERAYERPVPGRLEHPRRDLERLLVAPGEHEALGLPGFGVPDERLRAKRLESRKRLGEQLERLVEATRAGCDPPEVRRGQCAADRVPRGPPDALGLEKALLRLLEPALVREDLALVVLRPGDVDDIARTPAQLAAAPVELEASSQRPA